jgi:hypothetical protein
MFKQISFFLLAAFLFSACQGGFERFAPPANSISGRGAKVNPRILSTTPANGASVSPVTGATGTQIRVVFDMTMATSLTPVINTYVRDLQSNQIVWLSIPNSGSTFTWSSTTFLNDTLTIQLGWVRWPENNYIGFDFNNDTLQNLDDMPLANETRFSFYAQWDSGRYKVVHTGQYACYYYSPGQDKWIEREACVEDGGEPKVGTQDYPAGQNGFVDPMSSFHGPTIFGAASGGMVNGRRFVTGAHPQNLISTNCAVVGGTAACEPYSIDSITSLVWKTCSEGQTFWNVGDKCYNAPTDFTWNNAVNACSTLNLMNAGQGYGGRRDWRLPTVQELESLVDYGARNTFTGLTFSEPHASAPEAPAIHGYAQTSAPFLWEGPFPNTAVSKGYWTATGISALVSGQTYYSDAYVVEFKKGSMGAGGSTGALLESKRISTNRKKVRCVAGPDVLPAAQSLTPAVVAAGATLTATAAAFTGYEATAGFNITSATPAYDLQTDGYSITVQYSRTPNATAAGNSANYCIAAATATTCAVSSPTITTALPAGTNAYRLTLGSAMGANTAYKLFVNNVNTASDQWQTATPYTDGMYFYDSGNVYEVLVNHTSSSIATDIGDGDIELKPTFAGGQNYTANQVLYAPAIGKIVKVLVNYTSTASAQDDINNLRLIEVQPVITAAPVPLNLSRALFSGPLRSAAPTAAPAFNVVSATSPNLTTVQVTFNRVPDATQATAVGNYCIISPTADPFDCSAPLAAITAVTHSGYTATLTSSLTAGTAYVVIVNTAVTMLGTHVVNDSVNKLRWQRCRRGTLDTPTCADDGILTNENDYWNNQLNYCDSLNAQAYDGYQTTGIYDRYRWRAPTINELKSIANRSLFGTVGVSIDTTIFPTPNVLAEDFAASTNYSLTGPNTGANTPNYNTAWGFNYIAGFPSLSQKDYSELGALLKPPKKHIRCVRSLP